jgi:serine/threonine-protein kinase PknG
LDWLEAGNVPKASRLYGADFDIEGVRAGMEQAYRALAHEATDMWERITLVEKANAIRPRTRI